MKRKHHFVPQFYLRHFSSDQEEKRIHVYNLKRRVAFKDVSLKDQCYRHRFYGKQDDLEDAFSKLEGLVAPAIARIVESECCPSLGGDDHKALVMFVAVQQLRTAAAMIRVQENMNMMANAAFDGAPPADYLTDEGRALAMSLGNIPMLMAAIDDLRVHVVLAPSGHEFVTSDHPIARYNYYCQGARGWGVLGGTSRGLQISVPLAPGTLVILYDGGVYKVGRRGTALSSIATPSDMLRLNQLTFLAAHENLYFANWRQRDVVTGVVCSVVRSAAVRSRITEAIEEGNERSSLLHFYEEQPRIDVSLSFVTVRRDAKRIPLLARVRQYRKRLPLPKAPIPPDLADGRKHVFRVKTHKR